MAGSEDYHEGVRKISFAILLAVVVCMAGCKKPPQPPTTTKTFDVRGKVIETNPARSEVTLDHEAIPGFMEAMIMPYKVKDSAVLKELHPGDRITAKLFVEYDGEVYKNAKLDQIVVIAQGKPDYKPTMQFHAPAKGDVVPDFKLTNQNGKAIHLKEFQGRVLLITFVYTRCPLDDYCPKMSRNFAEIEKTLATDKDAAAGTHLLSISFDPAFDSPKVLKSYGEIYAGKTDFRHWEFAVPSQSNLQPMEEFFDLGVTSDDNKSLTHSLSTVVVDKSGRVAEWYPGNDWTAAQVAARMKELARAA